MNTCKNSFQIHRLKIWSIFATHSLPVVSAWAFGIQNKKLYLHFVINEITQMWTLARASVHMGYCKVSKLLPLIWHFRKGSLFTTWIIKRSKERIARTTLTEPSDFFLNYNTVMMPLTQIMPLKWKWIVFPRGIFQTPKDKMQPVCMFLK